jgi:hypothetical protein
MQPTPKPDPIILDEIKFTPVDDRVDGIAKKQQLLAVEQTFRVLSKKSIDTLAGQDYLSGYTGGSTYYDSFSSYRYIGGIVIEKSLRLGPELNDTSSINFGSRYRDDDTVHGTAIAKDNLVRKLVGIAITDKSSPTTLSTGMGADKVTGEATSNFTRSDSEIYGISLIGGRFGCGVDTGDGDDVVTGIATAYDPYFAGGPGLRVYGITGSESEPGKARIVTGDGDDVVTGNAIVGDAKFAGNFVYGIDNVWIDTGDGADRVTAKSTIAGKRSDAFGRNVNIRLGQGKDVMAGFGSLKADGGRNQDTWDLRDYRLSEFSIVKTDPLRQAVTLTSLSTGITATVEGFERFIFDQAIFTYDTLPTM